MKKGRDMVKLLLLILAQAYFVAFAATSALAAVGGPGDTDPPPRDVTKPTIAITTPPNNATYLLGQPVRAAYKCADEAGGSELYSCRGTAPNGAYINTSTVGPKSFTVRAQDNAGNTASVAHTYTVQPLPTNLPDLSISVAPAGVLDTSPTHCSRVTFAVTLETPSQGAWVSHFAAEYKIYSDIYSGTRHLGGGQVASGHTPDFGAVGGTKTIDRRFSLPANVVYPAGDYINKITVEVDPNKRISETREWNNSQSVYAHCIG
jgi:hypothetical protein